MKKILVTRKLLDENNKRLINIFDAKFNDEDRLLSTKELITLSSDCDGILSFPTTIIDKDTIMKLSNNIKIISNYAVGFGNIDVDAAKKKRNHCY